MKSKQLANVLIKILGLYVCLCAIPGFVSGFLLIFLPAMHMTWNDRLFGTLSYALGDVVRAVVGIIIITNSRKIAEFWFKANED